MKHTAKPVFFAALLLAAALAASACSAPPAQAVGAAKLESAPEPEAPVEASAAVKGDAASQPEIRGSVMVSFSPAGGYRASAEELDAAREILERRLMLMPLDQYRVDANFGSNSVHVAFYWIDSEVDPEQIVQQLGETAHLTLREVLSFDAGSMTPAPSAKDPILVEGNDVSEAYAFPMDTDSYGVHIIFTPQGAEAFAEATARLAGKGYISVWMDDILLSCPFVSQAITDGQVVISSAGMSVYDAMALADRINTGTLPFGLEPHSYRCILPGDSRRGEQSRR